MNINLDLIFIKHGNYINLKSLSAMIEAMAMGRPKKIVIITPIIKVGAMMKVKTDVKTAANANTGNINTADNPNKTMVADPTTSRVLKVLIIPYLLNMYQRFHPSL